MVYYPFTENVIPRLLAWRASGLGSALVTLINVDGSSPRQVGSQMAVAASGEYQGMISSGCAEAAIVAEAVACIAARAPRTVRFGKGSPYLDVVLPCGSGIDVHVTPAPPDPVLAALDAAMRARTPVSLALDPSGQNAPYVLATDAPRSCALFVRTYTPLPRLVILGRGPQVDHVAQLAHHMAWECVVASPDPDTLARAAQVTPWFQHLTRPEDFHPQAWTDPYTAVVLLFHDHEWEPTILATCEHTPQFYIGALGSRKTHAQRRELLLLKGCSQAYIDRIRSPIGLAIGGNSPPEIALAIAAEIASLAPR